MKSLIYLFSLFCLLNCTQKELHSESINNRKSKTQRAPLSPNDKLEAYKAWYKSANFKDISAFDRSFVSIYLEYLNMGSPQRAAQLVKLLRDQVAQIRGPLSSQWINVFDPHPALKHEDLNLDFFTQQRLLPLVKMGDPMAIELVIIFSAALEISSDKIKTFKTIIHSEYEEVFEAIQLKYADFFKLYPSSL